MNPLKCFLSFTALILILPDTVFASEIECHSRDTFIYDQQVTETQCRKRIYFNQAIEQNFYSYSPRFLEGVSIPNSIADILGVSLGHGFLGIKAFGFPEQKIGWDALALQNMYMYGLKNQQLDFPVNTKDIGNGFCSGLPIVECFSE